MLRIQEYVVHPSRPPTRAEIQALTKGCVVQGEKVVPVSVVRENDFVRIVVAEGRKREVISIESTSHRPQSTQLFQYLINFMVLDIYFQSIFNTESPVLFMQDYI